MNIADINALRLLSRCCITRIRTANDTIKKEMSWKSPVEVKKQRVEKMNAEIEDAKSDLRKFRSMAEEMSK